MEKSYAGEEMAPEAAEEEEAAAQIKPVVSSGKLKELARIVINLLKRQLIPFCNRSIDGIKIFKSV